MAKVAAAPQFLPNERVHGGSTGADKDAPKGPWAQDESQSDVFARKVSDGSGSGGGGSGGGGRKMRMSIKPPVANAGLFDFTDTEAIKARARAAKLTKHPYNVHDFYWSDGFFQRIAKDSRFENFTLSVIVMNALWISVDTDMNKADTILNAKPHFIAADVLFFGYFSLELFTRFMAFERKCSCFKDAWFVFDSALVFLYAFDPFTIGLIAHLSGGGGLNLPTAILRLFRLARLSRLVRMLRSLPELMIMIKGMMTATASVSYSLGLLMLITYIFAIAIRNLVPKGEFDEVREANEESQDLIVAFFPSVPEAMHQLIVFGAFMDDVRILLFDTKDQSTPAYILVWMYIGLAALTVMNMLIGVLCEVISAVAQEEQESMMVEKVQDKFGKIVEELDENGDGTLAWEEFQQILEYPAAMAALESVNVDPATMVDMAEDFFFEDGEPVAVSFEDFMGIVLDLRGGQRATVKDVMRVGKRFSKKFLKVNKPMDAIEARLKGFEAKLSAVLA
jgi:hypothetical protein